MTTEEGLSWLQSHQPLPDDQNVTEDILSTYDQIRKYFLRHPDRRCIPLFLHSFGGRNGFGVYQLIEDVLTVYSPEEVLPHLIESLQSSHVYVRQWSAEIAANFPAACLVSPLAALLADPDLDVKSGAIIALQQIHDERIAPILELYLENETDEDLRGLIIE